MTDQPTPDALAALATLYAHRADDAQCGADWDQAIDAQFPAILAALSTAQGRIAELENESAARDAALRSIVNAGAEEFLRRSEAESALATHKAEVRLFLVGLDNYLDCLTNGEPAFDEEDGAYRKCLDCGAWVDRYKHVPECGLVRWRDKARSMLSGTADLASPDGPGEGDGR